MTAYGSRPVTEWLSVSQVATILGVSKQRVWQMKQEGKVTVKATAIGDLYDPDEIDAMRQQRAARKSK